MRALIAAQDPAVVRAAQRALAELEVPADVCDGTIGAFEVLGKRTVELLLLDCDDPELAAQLLATVKALPSPPWSIAFVATPEAATAMMRAGAMTLHKPVTSANILKSLRAVRGLTYRQSQV